MPAKLIIVRIFSWLKAPATHTINILLRLTYWVIALAFFTSGALITANHHISPLLPLLTITIQLLALACIFLLAKRSKETGEGINEGHPLHPLLFCIFTCIPLFIIQFWYPYKAIACLHIGLGVVFTFTGFDRQSRNLPRWAAAILIPIVNIVMAIAAIALAIADWLPVS